MTVAYVAQDDKNAAILAKSFFIHTCPLCHKEDGFEWVGNIPLWEVNHERKSDSR